MIDPKVTITRKNSPGEIIFRNFKHVNGSKNGQDSITRNMKYILKPKKTRPELCEFIGTDKDHWDEDMHAVKEKFSYNGKNAVTHFVISTKNKVGHELFLKTALDFVRSSYGNAYMGALAGHEDCETHYHVHGVMLNINIFNGKSRQASPRELAQERRQVDYMFRRIGLRLHVPLRNNIRFIDEDDESADGEVIKFEPDLPVPEEYMVQMSVDEKKNKTDYDNLPDTIDYSGLNDLHLTDLVEDYSLREQERQISYLRKLHDGGLLPETTSDFNSVDRAEIAIYERGRIYSNALRLGIYGQPGKDLLKDIYMNEFSAMQSATEFSGGVLTKPILTTSPEYDPDELGEALYEVNQLRQDVNSLRKAVKATNYKNYKNGKT
jgi:hypothetical protein